MKEYKLDNDEVLLLEDLVKIDGYRGIIKLVVTSKNMLFEKEKGLFKKQYKVIGIIPLNSIKSYKGKLQIQNVDEILGIQASEDLTIYCGDSIRANNIIKTIKSVRSVDTFKKVVKTTMTIASTIAPIVLPMIEYAINENNPNKKNN